MSARTILILGGGFGGLAASNLLRDRLPPEHRVVVMERSAKFSLGLSYLWLMNGERRDQGMGERDLAGLRDKGIEWVAEEITRIGPQDRTVETPAQTLTADYLIIALGAELAPHALPGFTEAALNLYDCAGALAIQGALDAIESGRIVILISRTPFKCPAAPYEAAFLIDSLLRRKGVREPIELAVYTPEPQPMPVAGADVGGQLRAMLEDRGIEYHPDQIALSIDAGARRVLFELEDTSFDLLIGVPPHVAPQIVRDASLTDATGWVPVDPRTLQTRHAQVYAIGDVTAIRLPNGMFLPKAGVFAEEEARVVAENIAADITGKSTAAQFAGEGYCYVETGGGEAALGSGDFYASPAPQITLEAPSVRFRQEKEAFERTRLEAWL